MVDPGRLEALLSRLEEELGHLRAAAERSDDDLSANEEALAAVKYRFIVAIEVCIDAGEHVIASEGLRQPGSFAEVFSILGEAGYLPDDLVLLLEDMARFRNVLVHGYSRVQDRRVIEILKSRLTDLEAFRRSIAAAGE